MVVSSLIYRLYLIKSENMHGKQYKDYLYIIIKNIKDISPEETIELLKSLHNTGCSCAMLANLLIDSVYTDDEKFKKHLVFQF